MVVFSRRGYRATSMNDVAAGVGLSKPTLYHYVRTKQDLLVGIYEQVLDESLASARAIVAAAPTPLEAVRALVVERVRYTCEHQDLLKICFEEESELPDELAEPILERRRAFEAVVLGAVEAHLSRRPACRSRSRRRSWSTPCSAPRTGSTSGTARPVRSRPASWGSRSRRCSWRCSAAEVAGPSSRVATSPTRRSARRPVDR